MLTYSAFHVTLRQGVGPTGSWLKLHSHIFWFISFVATSRSEFLTCESTSCFNCTRNVWSVWYTAIQIILNYQSSFIFIPAISYNQSCSYGNMSNADFLQMRTLEEAQAMGTCWIGWLSQVPWTAFNQILRRTQNLSSRPHMTSK